MNILSRSELRVLAETADIPCVSIFMPTHRTGSQVRQNPIRLKNLLAKAEDYLTARGLRGPQAKTLLGQVRELLEDLPFWEHVSDGLALFVSAKLFRCYRLPARFEEVVVVADRFHIKPLIPLFAADGLYYVLALSQDQVRLLQCTRLNVKEIELKDTPKSLAELLKYSTFDKGLQMHSGAARRGGGKAASFHGHGSGTDEALKKRNILDFLHLVEKGVRKALGGERAPMVLAGVDYLRSLYGTVTTYPNVMEAGIPGNPDKQSAEGLHQATWAIVQPHFTRDQEEALARYRRLIGTGRVCEKLEDALLAASEGRVEVMFVSTGHHLWGKYEPRARVVYLHVEKEPGDDDLLNFAAIHTLLHGGTIFALEAERMPEKAPLAAVLRR